MAGVLNRMRFSLLSPRPSPGGRRRPDDPRPRPRLTFGSLWRIFLPAAILAIGGSVLSSQGDPNERPIWIFAAGVICGVIGAVSLFVGLIDEGRRERAHRSTQTPVIPSTAAKTGSDTHEP
jgi:drug/metabolite transporter (DMT)-like permease